MVARPSLTDDFELLVREANENRREFINRKPTYNLEFQYELS